MDFSALITAMRNYFSEIKSRLDTHVHDDRYYTKPQGDSRYAPDVHNHDTRYYTKPEVDSQLSTIDTGVPAGSVVMFPKNGAPTEYLKLDGRVYPTTTYPKLADLFPASKYTSSGIINNIPSLPDVGYSVSFSPNGEYLAVGHFGELGFTIFDTSDWSVAKHFNRLVSVNGFPTLSTHVAFSPNGNYLAIARSNELALVNLHDFSYQTESFDAYTEYGVGFDVEFNRNDELLAVATSAGKNLIVYNTSTFPNRVVDTPDIQHRIEGMAFSPTQDHLAVAIDVGSAGDSSELSPMTVYNTNNWNVLWRRGHSSDPKTGTYRRARDVAYSKEGNYLVFCLYDNLDDSEETLITLPNNGWIEGSVYSSNSGLSPNVIAVSSAGCIATARYSSSNDIQIYGLSGYTTSGIPNFDEMVGSTAYLPDTANSIEFSPDSRYLAVAHTGGDRLTIIEAESGDRIYLPDFSQHPPMIGGYDWYVKAE